MRKLGFIVFVFYFFSVIGYASNQKDTTKYFNWFNLDPEKDSIPGISTERAYSELLKGKESTPVIVAVIDGGVDINHEDLKGKIWVNDDEIPGNGIDDDKNGFIDDVNGWNFIGGSDGTNVNQETYEITRIYRKYKDRYDNVKSVPKEEKETFELYKKAKKAYFEKYEKAKSEMEFIRKFEENYNKVDSLAIDILKKKDYNKDDLVNLDPSGSQEATIVKSVLLTLYESGFSREDFIEYKEYIETKFNYHFNVDFNPRGIVGDDPDNRMDSIYGNNDIVASTPEHGTFVSGVIAADRDNNLGMKGIADNVKIMAIRAVPDGDERDKDVANAIIYAVNNGAQVINMSFGKDLSPQKELVDRALKYAESKDVILVHAAGNESLNTDKSPKYPQNLKDNLQINSKWLTIGASSIENGEELTGSFSNYGKKTVDVFAPGVDVYSLQPENKYDIMDGTSFAAPMVAGVAALLKSYYPSLSASEIKEIILASYTDYKDVKVNLPSKDSDKKVKKSKFGKLSATGGIINVYKAVQLAEKRINKI